MINEKISLFLKQKFQFDDQLLQALNDQKHIQKKITDLLVLFAQNKDIETHNFVTQQLEGIKQTLVAATAPLQTKLQKERDDYYTFS